MKIKTIEKLEDKINQDLAWRKFELFNLKTAIKSNNSIIGEKTLIRSGVALLCAHWEGFIRNVANYYVVYICSQKIKSELLTENFVALTLKKDFIRAGESDKNSVHVNLLEKIGSKKESVFFIKYNDTEGKRIINTESNLSYNLFVEILKSINIENIYETKQNYIDSEMLKIRHQVVHGEDVILDDYDFEEIYQHVLTIMEDFSAQIISAVENKQYLKTNNIYLTN